MTDQIPVQKIPVQNIPVVAPVKTRFHKKWLWVILGLLVVAGGLFFLVRNLLAVARYIQQNDFSGSATAGATTTNLTTYTSYDSKDSNLTADANGVRLNTTPVSVTEWNPSDSVASGDGLLSSNVKAWYKFDEASGTTVTDSSASPTNLYWSNPNRITGYSSANSAAHITNAGNPYATNFAYSGNNPAIQSTHTLSVEAWIRPQAVSNGWMGADSVDIISYYNPAGSGSQWGFTLGYRYYTGFHFDVYNLYGVGVVYPNASGHYLRPCMNQWQHVVVTYDDSLGSQNLKMYINGVLVGTTDFAMPVSYYSGLQLVVGDSYAQDGRRPFVGDIDNLVIYNTVLTPTQVANRATALYTTGSGTFISDTFDTNEASAWTTFNYMGCMGSQISFEANDTGTMTGAWQNFSTFSDSLSTAFPAKRYMRYKFQLAGDGITNQHVSNLQYWYGATQPAVTINYNSALATVDSISPTQAAKNSADFLLTVTGSGFITGNSQIYYNNAALATTFISATELQATVPTAAVSSTGTFPVMVRNTAGDSNAVNMNVVPSVYFASGTSSGAETLTQKNFTVNLSDISATDVVVNYSISGTAYNYGYDYNTPTSGQVTILAGNLSADLAVPLSDDSIDEDDETIIMTLDSVSGVNASVRSGENVETYTILDDDAAPNIYFSSATFSGSEGSYAYVSVQLSTYSGKTITIHYASTDGTASSVANADFTAQDGTLTIYPGNYGDSIYIPLTSDVILDADETFTVDLDPPTNAILTSPSSTTVTITDVPPPSVYMGATTVQAIEGNYIYVYAYMNGYSPNTVTVNFTLTDVTATQGSDYTAYASSIVIYPYYNYGYTYFYLSDDGIFESNETFDITLTSADYATIDTPATTTATILDNHPTISGQEQNIMENNAPYSQTQTVTLQLGGTYSGNVTAHVAKTGGSAVAGTDYVSFTPQDVTIPANTSSATFNVTTIKNSVTNDARSIEFTLSNCNCSIGTTTFTVNIIDNNPIVYGVSQSMYENNPQSQAVMVYLSQPFPVDVNVDVSITTGGTAVAGTDYVNPSGPITVTIPANNSYWWFEITTISDSAYNDPVSIEFSLSNCVNCNISSPTFEVTIYDNNESASFGAAGGDVVEGLSDNNDYVHIYSTPSVAETVNFHVSNSSTATYGDDYTITSAGAVNFDSGTMTGTITFGPGETYEYPQINVVDDFITDPNETVILVLDSYSAGQIGSNPQFTYLIKDPEASVTRLSYSDYESSYNQAYTTITLNKSFANLTTVNFHLVNVGTTTYGYSNDYVVNQWYHVTYDSNTNIGTVQFDPYTTSMDVYFSIINDDIMEPDEIFQLVIYSYDSGSVNPTADTFTDTIQNDDANSVNFTVASASGSESTSSYNIGVSLDIPDTTQDTTFDFSISGTASNGGVDYTLASGTRTITQNSLSNTFPLAISNDTLDEPGETVVVSLTNISGNVSPGTILTFTYTINDDDSPSAKIFLDADYLNEANTGANKIPAGLPIYFRVNDARFNSNAGGVDTISTQASAISTPGSDSETVILTEIGANENVFLGSISTATGSVTVGDGNLQITGSDIVNLELSGSSSSVFYDFSNYSSTSDDPGALTSGANGLQGYWIAMGGAAGSPSLQDNAGNQYLSATSDPGNMLVAQLKSDAAAAGYDFSSENMVFDIAISDTSYSTATFPLGEEPNAQTFTGFNVILVDNAGCGFYQSVPDAISTNSSSLTTVSLLRSLFIQSTLTPTCSFNFSDVRDTYFVVPSFGVNTVTLDNLGQATIINGQSPDAAVIGGASPITNLSASNPTTSTIDLSWSANTDLDFLNYKIYYATHSNVTTSDTLATLTPINTQGSGTLNYTLTGLSPSTLYYAKVMVTNTSASVAPSNEASATTSAVPVVCGGPGEACIMNLDFSSLLTTITIGTQLYFQVADSSFNTSGSPDTLILWIDSSGGDAEPKRLTETGPTTGVFRSGVSVGTALTDALGTSATNSVGILQVAGGDTITASIYITPTVIDDFSAGIGGWTDLSGGANAGTFNTSPTDHYFRNIDGATNADGFIINKHFASPLNMGAGPLNLDINVDDKAKLSATGTMFTTVCNGGMPFPMKNITILVTSNGDIGDGCAALPGVAGMSMLEISPALLTDNVWATIANSQSSFTPFYIAAFPAVNWSQVSDITIFVATGNGSTLPSNSMDFSMSNISSGTSSSYNSNVVDVYSGPISAVQFSAPSGSDSESVTPVNLTVDIEAGATQTAKVDFALSGTATYTSDFTIASSGTNYTFDSGTGTGTITFPLATTSVILPLAIINDSAPEPSETIILTLSKPSINASIGANSVYTQTIVDDDTVSVLIKNCSPVAFSDTLSSITVGDTLCLEVYDPSLDMTGAPDTITVRVTSSGGDIELRTLLETGDTTHLFQSGTTVGTGLGDALGTASANSAGVLQVASGGSVVAHVVIGSATLIDDFSTYADTADMVNYTHSRFWESGDNVLSLNAGGYLDADIGTSPDGVLAGLSATANPVSFGTDSLNFSLKASTLNFQDQSNDLGSGQTFTGINLLVQDTSGRTYTAPITAVTTVDAWTPVILAQGDFSPSTAFGPAPETIDWDNIQIVYFIAVTNGATLVLSIDDLGRSGDSGYDSPAVAVGGTGIEVTAIVPPILSLSLSSSICTLPGLNVNSVKTCNFTITTSTNAVTGYSAYIRDSNNGSLVSPNGSIPPAGGGNLISKGEAGFGISTGTAGQEVVQNGSCADGDTLVASGLSTGSKTLGHAGQPVADNDTVVCIGATASPLTPAGTYMDTLTITVVSNF